MKIDYSENKPSLSADKAPWWLKYTLDGVVEVTLSKLLGKVHISVIPGLPFTVGYFELEQK